MQTQNPSTDASPSHTSESTDPLLSKISKHLDTYKAKISKLTEENTKLKKSYADLKSQTTRVRRIPTAAAAAVAPK